MKSTLRKYKVRVPNFLQDTGMNLSRERQLAPLHGLYFGFNCKRGLYMICDMTIFRFYRHCF